MECFNSNRDQAANDAYDIENDIIAENINNPLCLNGHYRKGGYSRFKNNMGHPFPHSDEAKIKMKIAQNRPEFRTAKSIQQKISQNRPEVVDKKRKANLGYIHSESSKLNMTKSQIGRGIEYNGRGIVNFCKLHELSEFAMQCVCKGIQNNHKGWKGHYVRDVG